MVRGAAFFDLDRTLLPCASGPAFATALRERGVLPERPVPGERALFEVFDLLGETPPSMMLARRAVRLSKGWDVAEFERAGEIAAARLLELVQPYVRREMTDHQREGRLNVVATASPEALVRPFAAALGFDDVVATRYGHRNGALDGTVDGHYVWGEGKLAAMREWAHRHAVELEASWAYSDSWYDLPMLGAVGRPVVVNPDPRLGAAAVARGWPVRWLDAPDSTRAAGAPRLPVEPRRALLAVARPELFPYARFHIEGTHHVPRDGPAILAANHRSHFDIVAMALALARSGRVARLLATRELFDAPVIGRFVAALGGIPVDRGTDSTEPLRDAAEALDAGEMVAILPQGTIPRDAAFFEPELRGHPAVARLAAMTGAPVVPMAIWGTEHVWPPSASVPNIFNVLRPPRVTVRVGEPLPLPDGIDPADGTELVMSAIYDELPAEAKVRHEPSAAEVARTIPRASRAVRP